MKATIIIKDEVNCKIAGLDINTRKKLTKKFKFKIPYAVHTPAYKLGRWDGMVSFFQMGGSTFINLLPEILPILVSDKYEIELDDRRDYNANFEFEKVDVNSFSDRCWPEGHQIAGQPIIMRDHQVDTINGFFENTQSLQEVATGAGKTLVTAALSLKCEEYGRSIVVVPNRSLVTQTEEDYINMGLDVGVIFGGRHEYDKTHTIVTWQSIASMMKKDKAGTSETTLNEFLEGIVAIIVDECHGMKADVLKSMLQGPMSTIPIRWGLTGTIPKEDFEFMALLTSIGDVTNRVTAKSLQEKGILSNCFINILQFKDYGDYGNYQSEMKYLTSDIARLEQMARTVTDINESGNTLMLVNHIKTGNLLAEMIPNSIFLSGGTKDVKRKEEYDKIRDVDNRVIIATFGIAAVGLNIPRIFNLVLFEPGKSFVRVIQSIGRGLRVASDKDHVEIWDLTSTCKFAKRHLTQRKKFYKEAEYKFKITKIDRD